MITVGLCGRSPEVKDSFVQEAPKDDVEQDVLQLTVEEKAPVVEDEEEPLEEPFNFKIWSEQPPLVEDSGQCGSLGEVSFQALQGQVSVKLV